MKSNRLITVALLCSLLGVCLLIPWQTVTTNGTGDGLYNASFIGFAPLWSPPALAHTSKYTNVEISWLFLSAEIFLVFTTLLIGSGTFKLKRLNATANSTFYLVTLLVAVAVASSLIVYSNLIRASEWSKHTYLVLNRLSDLELLLATTKFDTQHYTDQQPNLKSRAQEISLLTRDNPAQQVIVSQISDNFTPNSLTIARLAELLPRQQGLITAAKEQERMLLDSRTRSLSENTVVAGAFTTFFGLSALGLLFWLYRTLQRLLVSESRRNQELTVEIEKRRIAESELENTLIQLKRSNADLQQFAYVASHDLQEPLRAVTGFLTLLLKQQDNKLTDASLTYINHAVQGAARMKALINDLLTFARVETRGLEFVNVDLNKVLGDVRQDLSSLIAETNTTIHSSNLPIIRGDVTQMRQLLLNLISNAIKFRGPDPPDVKIDWHLAQESFQLSVSDNGRGFDMAHAERIFVIFQRLQSREEVSGTGIGLALCKKIVERHGGKIWVDSTIGNGTTFYLTIPKIEMATQAA